MTCLAALVAWLNRLGSALTGDAPHPFTAEYPWHGSCWCGKPEEHEVHQGARRLLGAQREARR